MKKIDLSISGMECPNCSMILERIEDKLVGVKTAEASYHKSKMVVVYDDGIVNQAQIKEEIERMGYQVTAIESK